MKDRSTTTALDPSDIRPLPDSVRHDFRDVMVAKFGSRMGERTFDLLWTMIVSATWEYRQTAPINQLDVQATLTRVGDLERQLDKELGLKSDDFDFIARTMITLGPCAGFFGLYLDRWLLSSIDDEEGLARDAK